jgi:creatinine amidohydrolase
VSEKVLISELSWTSYAEKLKRGNPIIILPVGSLEQHGPHSPLASDTIIPNEIGKAVAARIGGLLAPAIAYGYKSMPRTGGGNHFPGTTSLDGDTLVRLTRDIICEFARHGARRILILDSHYENEMFLIEGIDLALKDLKSWGIAGLKVMKVRYFEFISDATLAKVFPEGFPGWPLEHAGICDPISSIWTGYPTRSRSSIRLTISSPWIRPRARRPGFSRAPRVRHRKKASCCSMSSSKGLLALCARASGSQARAAANSIRMDASSVPCSSAG